MLSKEFNTSAAKHKSTVRVIKIAQVDFAVCLLILWGILFMLDEGSHSRFMCFTNNFSSFKICSYSYLLRERTLTRF